MLKCVDIQAVSREKPASQNDRLNWRSCRYLAVVDGLCRLLGHRIELRSTVGRGSSFEVRVPRETEGSDKPSAEVLWQNELQGCTVLVIDDDPSVLEAMNAVLTQWQCLPLLAENIEEAMSALDLTGQIPEVIVSDYRLPGGLTGDTAIAAVRNRLGREVPAVILTGDTAPARLRDAAAGGFLLLHKPVRPARLRAALVVLRERSSLQQESSRAGKTSPQSALGASLVRASTTMNDTGTTGPTPI